MGIDRGLADDFSAFTAELSNFSLCYICHTVWKRKVVSCFLVVHGYIIWIFPSECYLFGVDDVGALFYKALMPNPIFAPVDEEKRIRNILYWDSA